MRTLSLGVLVFAASLAAGCSAEQVYNAAAGWRRNECYKIGDLEQRERCLKEADRPYDVYRSQSGQSR
jgi:outer membrane protein assembly factor BamD (BamD/ComL family)